MSLSLTPRFPHPLLLLLLLSFVPMCLAPLRHDWQAAAADEASALF
jgi:hypothetical protein